MMLGWMLLCQPAIDPCLMQPYLSHVQMSADAKEPLLEAEEGEPEPSLQRVDNSTFLQGIGSAIIAGAFGGLSHPVFGVD